jgi:hypothetical protein
MNRHIRLIAAATVLVGLVTFGLADYASSSSSDVYTVQAGDSLWAIATSRGITVAQLASANRMNPNDILLIGRRLVIPGQSAASTPSQPVVVAAAPNRNPVSFCATFRPSGGSWGRLPAGLAGSSRYYQLRPIFQEWSNYYDISLPLLEAVAWQESGWQQGVVSPTGAIGVGQVEPYTATFITTNLVGHPLNIHSAADNIHMSAAFLNYLAEIEGNNRCATIAAYYEGPLNLQTRGVLPSAQQYVADVEALLPEFE